MENNKYILVYSLNDDNNFTVFLPSNLEDEKEKDLFDFITDPKSNSIKHSSVVKLPITFEVYKYLIDLKVNNFENITKDLFFKEHRLEEWVL
jgi:hypothetical protein